MKLPRNDGGDFKPAPEGTWPAICYGLLDLGTQQTSFQGQVGLKHQVLISWELHDDECTMEGGAPMSVHKRYTWSMNEKANLRKHLSAWVGRKLIEAGDFDVKRLIGLPCMIGIEQSTKEDKTYSNVISVGKLAKNTKIGRMHNDPRFLSLTPGEYDAAVFLALPEGLQGTIKRSPEYQELQRKGSGAQMEAALDDEEEAPY